MATSVGWGTHADDVSWVAMAESSGDDKVVNGIGAVGLLQINQPVHVHDHPNWTVSWLQNPLNNLSAGLILFNAAGKTFGPDWADSRSKGGIPEGWGPHVSAAAGGTGGGSSTATQVDDPCALLKGTPGYDYCVAQHSGGSGTPSLGDTAAQIGRLAQALAKAGNWVANPANWVRVAYVAGGAVLALVAVNVIVQPYAARSYGQITRALPIRTVRDVARQARPNPKTEE